MVDKLPETPYPGITPWLGVRKKINEVIDEGGSVDVTWDDIADKPTFATVATSGDYDDLTDKPTGINITRSLLGLGMLRDLYTISPTSDVNRGSAVQVALYDTTEAELIMGVFYVGGTTTGDILTMTFLGLDGQPFQAVTDISTQTEIVTVNGNTVEVRYVGLYEYGATFAYE